jgi:hypothetical protein
MQHPLIRWRSAVLVLACLLIGTATAKAQTKTPTIAPLMVRGEDFVDPQGKPVRFWGVNLVALYPDRATSERLAQNLATLQVNLVRPHHMLRPSTDWNPNMVSGALVTYKNDSRTPDPVAWDRFDSLNAALRKQGIYLALAVNWSRNYLPGDVDILTTTSEDHDAWVAALKEFNSWDWQRKRDVQKMLPIVDERAALLEEEFARRLLQHQNPYTKVTYGNDPQILTLEVLNETSTEYAVINGNRLPDYWNRKLVEKWQAFAAQQKVDPGDLYSPKTEAQKQTRAAFFQDLDRAYLRRMTKVVRNTGSKAPIIFSNLWRGDTTLKWQSQESKHVEDHLYTDPLVAEGATDGFYGTTLTQLAGKPYFLGELNISEGEDRIRSRGPYRTMLTLAASAYGSFYNWSGVVWFAWLHGGRQLGQDGWAADEGRSASIGDLITDGMQLDHFRTAGMIFRRGLVKKSAQPVTWYVDEPLWAADYHGLMRGKENIRAGWHSVHSFRKAYGPVPESQRSTPWMTQDPGGVLVSDTGQIVRDTTTKQFSVVADQTEDFSGFLGKTPTSRLKHLKVSGLENMFATVLLVAADGQNLSLSKSLVLSRTGLDKANSETEVPAVRLTGLRPASKGKSWYIRLVRPRASASLLRDFGGIEWRHLPSEINGDVVLPKAPWHECELQWR